HLVPEPAMHGLDAHLHGLGDLLPGSSRITRRANGIRETGFSLGVGSLPGAYPLQRLPALGVVPQVATTVRHVRFITRLLGQGHNPSTCVDKVTRIHPSTDVDKWGAP